MESVRLKINGHMAALGGDILCVLDKQQCGADAGCRVKLHARVFVMERISTAAQLLYSLFQREMETLGTLQNQHNLQDVGCHMDLEPHTADQGVQTSTSSLQVKISSPARTIKEEPEDNMDLNCLHVPVCKEEDSIEEEWSSTLVQEEPQPPQVIVELEELLETPEVAVKSEDDDHDENREMEPVASTTTEHMKTHACAENCGTLRPIGGASLSSRRSESNFTEDSDEWEDTMDDLWAVKILMSQNARRAGRPCKLSQDLTSPEQTRSTWSHAGKRTFCCTECGKIFKRKHHLTCHVMSIHSGEKPLACEVCGKCFAFKYALKAHTTTHTRPFSCTVCGKGFTSRSLLTTHLVTHTGKKPFACTICGKGSGSASRLKSHMMTHTGTLPYPCTVCGKGFTQKCHLKTHMMIHTGEKPVCCTVCGKGFIHTGNLKTHMMTHTGEKPFSCTVCGKGSVSASHLKRHMMSHTGERPFSCTVCGKGFIHRSHLKTHMETHTQEKRLSCTV